MGQRRDEIKKNPTRFSFRRPRHTLKNRQDPEQVAAATVRIAELKRRAAAGEIVLLFQDESEARTHPYLARTWAPVGADLRVEAPGQSKRVAMLGVREHSTGEMTVVTSRSKKSIDFIGMLEVLDRKFGPEPQLHRKPTVMVIDNGPIHTSKLSAKALAERATWLTTEWLPKYTPELNDIERDWKHLKEKEIANTCVDGCPERLEALLNEGIANVNARRLSRLTVQREAA
jgi:transposase